jgi:hypothetical protein
MPFIFVASQSDIPPTGQFSGLTSDEVVKDHDQLTIVFDISTICPPIEY